MFEQQAKDKIKRIVCRHWLKHECQRGDACTYLHEMDFSRMPECDLGANCNRPGCIFKHPPKMHDVGVGVESSCVEGVSFLQAGLLSLWQALQIHVEKGGRIHVGMSCTTMVQFQRQWTFPRALTKVRLT